MSVAATSANTQCNGNGNGGGGDGGGGGGESNGTNGSTRSEHSFPDACKSPSNSVPPSTPAPSGPSSAPKFGTLVPNRVFVGGLPSQVCSFSCTVHYEYAL